MGQRGRDQLVRCENCGRNVPRNKTVTYEKRTAYSTDTRSKDDIKFFSTRKAYYCPSCGKHFGIYKKKLAAKMRKYNQ